MPNKFASKSAIENFLFDYKYTTLSVFSLIF